MRLRAWFASFERRLRCWSSRPRSCRRVLLLAVQVGSLVVQVLVAVLERVLEAQFPAPTGFEEVPRIRCAGVAEVGLLDQRLHSRLRAAMFDCSCCNWASSFR